MSRILAGTTAVLCTLGACSAFAGGIERNAPATRALFEPGKYLEFSGRFVSPEQNGTGGAFAPAGATGDLLESFASLGFAYKSDINEQLSYAVIVDDPWGVDTDYATLASSNYSGTTAELNSVAITGILSYDVKPNIKVFGGVRAQAIDAAATITVSPLFSGYSIDASRDIGFGYLVGAAYSKPEIALRVALTYYSEIDHALPSVENIGPTTVTSDTDITTPQSVSLEFQSGVAEDTLVFGSVRWVDWSEFAISPLLYTGSVTGSPLVDYAKDWTTYSLGVGRRFNDIWSGALLASYEPASNTTLTTLGPVDGRKSLGAALTYTMDNMKITGGLSYVWLGDATNVLGTNFTGGDAIVAGFRISMAL